MLVVFFSLLIVNVMKFISVNYYKVSIDFTFDVSHVIIGLPYPKHCQAILYFYNSFLVRDQHKAVKNRAPVVFFPTYKVL